MKIKKGEIPKMASDRSLRMLELAKSKQTLTKMISNRGKCTFSNLLFCYIINHVLNRTSREKEC